MSEVNETLAIMTEGWQAYQEQLSAALAPLTPEQLALRAAPGLRSIEELARHIIRVRAAWFHDVLDVGDEEFAAVVGWNNPESPTRTADELVHGLTATWQVLQAALSGYSPADLRVSITKERWGQQHTFTRGWVIWHVIEHDLHHGGEIGYSLGMHGLQAPDI